MDCKEYLSKQIKGMRNLQDAALESLTDEQLMVIPAGTVSPIGVIWLHMIYSEDSFIAILMQKPTLWESGGWKESFNLEKAPDFGEDWTIFRDSGLSVDLLKSYTEAVRAETDACLESTTSATLDERIKFFTESDPKADVWVLLSQHGLLHTGEIAALKGLQGLKGLPF